MKRRVSEKDLFKLRMKKQVRSDIKVVPLKPDETAGQKADPMAQVAAKLDALLAQHATNSEALLGGLARLLIVIKQPLAPVKAREVVYTITDRDRRGDIKTVTARAKEI